MSVPIPDDRTCWRCIKTKPHYKFVEGRGPFMVCQKCWYTAPLYTPEERHKAGLLARNRWNRYKRGMPPPNEDAYRPRKQVTNA